MPWLSSSSSMLLWLPLLYSKKEKKKKSASDDRLGYKHLYPFLFDIVITLDPRSPFHRGGEGFIFFSFLGSEEGKIQLCHPYANEPWAISTVWMYEHWKINTESWSLELHHFRPIIPAHPYHHGPPSSLYVLNIFFFHSPSFSFACLRYSRLKSLLGRKNPVFFFFFFPKKRKEKQEQQFFFKKLKKKKIFI